MPFPPARSTITSIPTTLICLRRCVASIDQRQNRLLKSGKKCLVVIDERRQTLGGWRIVGCLMRQLIDRWKIKKPLPTCFFHQSSIAWRKGKEISSLSTYEGSFLRCVSMLEKDEEIVISHAAQISAAKTPIISILVFVVTTERGILLFLNK